MFFSWEEEMVSFLGGGSEDVLWKRDSEIVTGVKGFYFLLVFSAISGSRSLNFLFGRKEGFSAIFGHKKDFSRRPAGEILPGHGSYGICQKINF